MQLKDTCAEGDRDSNNIDKKRLLLYFKSSNSFTKYSIEMFTSIAQIEAIVPEEITEQLTWGRFVNWHGSEGRTLPIMLPREFVMIHPKMLWTAWAQTRRQKPSSEYPCEVLVYMKSSVHSTKKPTSTGFPKHTVHKLLLKMSWWYFKIWKWCLADVMLTFLILQSPPQPTLMWESCSLSWKGTRTKLEGPFSQYSFIMYVWQLALQTFLTQL